MPSALERERRGLGGAAPTPALGSAPTPRRSAVAGVSIPDDADRPPGVLGTPGEPWLDARERGDPMVEWLGGAPAPLSPRRGDPMLEALGGGACDAERTRGESPGGVDRLGPADDAARRRLGVGVPESDERGEAAAAESRDSSASSCSRGERKAFDWETRARSMRPTLDDESRDSLADASGGTGGAGGGLRGATIATSRLARLLLSVFDESAA